jgi:hypothetical protein
MAQPFLPPPPSSTRRRQRQSPAETSALVQQTHSPAIQRPVESIVSPDRLLDFGSSSADLTAAPEQPQAWSSEQAQDGQPSIFDVGSIASQATSSNFPGHAQPQSPPQEFTGQTVQYPVQFGNFPSQLTSPSPAATTEWSGGQSLTADVTVSEKDPDEIDFQISQMEKELAELDAMSSQYDDDGDLSVEFGTIGTQEQKFNQTPQTGIYDFPLIPAPPYVERKAVGDPFGIDQYSQSGQMSPPGTEQKGVQGQVFDPFNLHQYSQSEQASPSTEQKTVGQDQTFDPFSVNQYSQSGQAPVLLDFDSAFPGNSAAMSQVPFPPQEPISKDALNESPYANPIEIRQRKSSKQSATRVNPLNPKQSTHKAVHDFRARHDDEVDLNKGDPVIVKTTASDGWCTGTNVTTGRSGIFPASCVLSNSHPSLKKMLGAQLPQFPVKFLGTVPLKAYRGMKYLSAAISKVVAARQRGNAPPPVLQVLEVSEQGLRVYPTVEGAIDKSKRPNFFPLEKVTYIGAHPQHRKFFGFINESPSREGVFVCSVFVYGSDARPVCGAVSQAFKKLKGAFLDHSNPTYDFYAE